MMMMTKASSDDHLTPSFIPNLSNIHHGSVAIPMLIPSPFSSNIQHLSCGVCLEVRGEIIRTPKTFSFPTGLIPRSLGPSNDFTLLSGWICLHGVLD